MLTRRYKAVTVMRPAQMQADRNDVMKKGRTLIASLSEKEREHIFNQLDVYNQVLFTQIQNCVWSNL